MQVSTDQSRSSLTAKRYDHIARLLRQESGQTLILVALMMSVLLAFMALAIDVGRMYYTQRELQSAADAAAMAAAIEIGDCGGTANCSAMQTAATTAISEIGWSGVTLATNCASPSTTGTTLILNNGPCELSGDPNKGSTASVEAVMAEETPTIFANLFGSSKMLVTARAEAGLGNPKFCTYILGARGTTATFNGHATYTASCGMMIDAVASPAAIFNGNDTITTTALDVAGSIINNGNNSINPAPVTNAPIVPDPLSSHTMPTVGACGTSTSSPYSGSKYQVTVGGQTTATFNPGTYCGGITLNGGATASFNPGTYVISGSMIADGQTSITGSGVTLYFDSGSLTLNGGAHVALTAPSSGTYEGMLYMQNRNDTSTVIMDGDTTSLWQGVIYAPSAELILNGGANLAAYTDVVVGSIIENGNVNFTMNSDYSSLANGSPIKSTTAVLTQ